MNLTEALGNLKASGLIAGTTFASGMSLVIGLIPDDIGKLASLAGVALTIYMIIWWRKRGVLADLDIQLKRLEVIERQKNINEKRRADDQLEVDE